MSVRLADENLSIVKAPSIGLEGLRIRRTPPARTAAGSESGLWTTESVRGRTELRGLAGRRGPLPSGLRWPPWTATTPRSTLTEARTPPLYDRPYRPTYSREPAPFTCSHKSSSSSRIHTGIACLFPRALPLCVTTTALFEGLTLPVAGSPP